MLNTPAIAPSGEARSNNDVFRALAGRLGFEPELFPDDETLIREALDGGPTLAGITLERLREAEEASGSNLPDDYAPFADGRFPTPSGKCELYSERMLADGLDPLPTYTPPLEDPQTRPDLADEVSAPAPEPAPAELPQLDLRRDGEAPPPGRRADGRAFGGRRRIAQTSATASGRRSTMIGAGSSPGST